ncbi:kinase-like domain-containing protein [Aspergillus californicus]
MASTLEIIASADLTPTEHSLLKEFITEAVDPEYAAQRDTVSTKAKDLVKYRDGPHCCFPRSEDDLMVTGATCAEAAWIIPPGLFDDEEMIPKGPLFALLTAFLTPAKTLQLQDILRYRDELHLLRNLWLLSPSVHSAFRGGHIQIVLSNPTSQWTDAIENQSEETEAADYIACRSWPEELVGLSLSDGTPFSDSFHPFTIHSDNPATYYLPSNVLFRMHFRIASALHLFFIEDCVAAGWPRPPLFTWTEPAQQLLRRCWHLVPKRVRLWFYHIMSQLGTYLYPSENFVTVRRLPFGLYLKICARSQQNEPVALRLVEQHTSIPAPLWIDDYEEDGNTTLIMTQVKGQTLHSVFHRLSYSERELLSQDLREIIGQIRRVPNQTPYRFGNTLGGALVDHRAGTFGPFHRESDFYDYLADHAGPVAQNALAQVRSRQYRSFFTHSDLHSTNISINRGRLAGIIDWECAGYYPDYWEFTKAFYGIINEAQEKIIRGAFDEDYEDELRVEKLLWLDAPFGL